MLDKHKADQKSDKRVKMMTSIWASRLMYAESRGLNLIELCLLLLASTIDCISIFLLSNDYKLANEEN